MRRVQSLHRASPRIVRGSHRVSVIAREWTQATDLGHLGQVQGGPRSLRVLGSPAFHADLLVVEDAGLRAAPGQAPGPRPPAHLRGGVRGAGPGRAPRPGEADLFVREVEGPRGGGLEAGEGEAGQLEARREGVGAGGQAEAGAALHGGERAPPRAPPLHAPPAVAAPLLHRRPHARALGSPRRPAAARLVRAGQGAALALAGRGRGAGFNFAQAQVPDQAGDGDGGGGARLLGPAPAPWARHRQPPVPQALQAGADRRPLDGTAPPQVPPSICPCAHTHTHTRQYSAADPEAATHLPTPFNTDPVHLFSPNATSLHEQITPQ